MKTQTSGIQELQNLILISLWIQQSFAYIDGASKHRSSLHSFLEDEEEVCGGVLRLVHLAHAAREVLHRLHGASSFQGFIAAIQPEREAQEMTDLHKQVWRLKTRYDKTSRRILFCKLKCILGIGLLQKCTPELSIVSGVDEHQLVPHTRESVVHHHIHPFIMLPELHNKVSLIRVRGHWETVEREFREWDSPGNGRFQHSRDQSPGHVERPSLVCPHGGSGRQSLPTTSSLLCDHTWRERCMEIIIWSVLMHHSVEGNALQVTSYIIRLLFQVTSKVMHYFYNKISELLF